MQLLSGNDNNVKMSDLKLGKKDVLIERLQEALKNPNMTSDDVCNLLSNDLYEREKLAQQIENAKGMQSSSRFTCRHL